MVYITNIINSDGTQQIVFMTKDTFKIYKITIEALDYVAEDSKMLFDEYVSYHFTYIERCFDLLSMLTQKITSHIGEVIQNSQIIE